MALPGYQLVGILVIFPTLQVQFEVNSFTNHDAVPSSHTTGSVLAPGDFGAFQSYFPVVFLDLLFKDISLSQHLPLPR